MLTDERINAIFQYLKEHKTATVEELGKLLYVSAATVRRDLSKMEKMGMIERNHGGAVFYEHANEVSIFVRLGKNAKEKELSAFVALKHLPDFKTVFIDNSSTCLALAERMNFSNKTILTNGLEVAAKLSQKEGVHLIMPGGEIYYNTNSVTGTMACNNLLQFRIDLMLSSCAALDLQGSYEQTLETAQLKRVAFEQSRIRLLVADQTKFDQVAAYKTKSLGEYDGIFTNAEDELVQHYRKNGFRVFNR